MFILLPVYKSRAHVHMVWSSYTVFSRGSWKKLIKCVSLPLVIAVITFFLLIFLPSIFRYKFIIYFRRIFSTVFYGEMYDLPAFLFWWNIVFYMGSFSFKNASNRLGFWKARHFVRACTMMERRGRHILFMAFNYRMIIKFWCIFILLLLKS